MEALDQYNQKGYIQKLKTDITSDLIQSTHQECVALLYMQVTHMDGMYFSLARRKKQWYAYLTS
jgi:hypothetical protein